jgi:hypothetical protein
MAEVAAAICSGADIACMPPVFDDVSSRVTEAFTSCGIAERFGRLRVVSTLLLASPWPGIQKKCEPTAFLV